MYREFLLTDELEITYEDYIERKKLINIFKTMPNDFFAKLRHFQPQIGCLNACSICSKHASTNVSEWNKSRIRNVIAALKFSTPATEFPLIVWERKNHRNGVIFSYLDNDVGIYINLDTFIKVAYEQLGVKTRISTVGFSRYNDTLNETHKNINKYIEALGGVRLSFTPYSIGWACNNANFSREEYEHDITNFLNIYKPYFESVGSGSRDFCIELRYSPLVVIEKVITFTYQNHFVIYSDNYLYVSEKENIEFTDTYIQEPHIHRLSLNNNGESFYKINLNRKLNDELEIRDYLNDNFENVEKSVTIYKVTNKDGEYFSIDPQLTDAGNKGINIYPKTQTRTKSGYIITERYFLNALFEYKKEKGLKSTDCFPNATWTDVEEVIKKLEQKMLLFLENDELEKYKYLSTEILPMINTYKRALYSAGYHPSNFFDKNFTIDTGIICNLGRAIHEFKGLVSFENEPLTLNHERNYGNINSTMTKEGTAWRLSCEYDNNILIEELDLSSTATIEGQQRFNQNIKLDPNDETINFPKIKKKCFIPGQKEIKNGY